jgi:hypothetical protein
VTGWYGDNLCAIVDLGVDISTRAALPLAPVVQIIALFAIVLALALLVNA